MTPYLKFTTGLVAFSLFLVGFYLTMDSIGTKAMANQSAQVAGSGLSTGIDQILKDPRTGTPRQIHQLSQPELMQLVAALQTYMMQMIANINNLNGYLGGIGGNTGTTPTPVLPPTTPPVVADGTAPVECSNNMVNQQLNYPNQPLHLGNFWVNSNGVTPALLYRGGFLENHTMSIRFTATGNPNHPTHTGQFRVGVENTNVHGDTGGALYALAISKCPGDFTDQFLAQPPAVAACRNWGTRGLGTGPIAERINEEIGQGGISYKVSSGTPTSGAGFCTLEAGETYYLNISTKPEVHPEAFCESNSGSCAFYLKDAPF